MNDGDDYVSGDYFEIWRSAPAKDDAQKTKLTGKRNTGPDKLAGAAASDGLAAVQLRVDQALRENRPLQRCFTWMVVALFVVGLSVLVFAYYLRNPYVLGGGVLVYSFFTVPLYKLGRLRRDNLILQTFPAFISMLEPHKADEEIVKLLNYLRDER